MKTIHITIAENGDSGLFLIKPYSDLNTALRNFRTDAEEVAKDLDDPEDGQKITIDLDNNGNGIVSNGIEEVVVEIHTRVMN